MRDYAELVKALRESAELADRLAVLMGRDVGDAKAPLMRKAADAIEELLAAVPHWHPVSEPPKENKEYLVYIPNVGLVTKANYLYGEWNYDSLHMKITHLISHWMALPVPPKGVE